jgi:hypothetical protein
LQFLQAECSGGGLYFAASFSTAINLLLLRFGPRFLDATDESNINDIDISISSPTMGGTNNDEWKNLVDKDIESGKPESYGGIETIQPSKRGGMDRASLYARQASMRNRPTLM